MKTESQQKCLETLEQELYQEILDFDNICTNVMYYQEVMEQSFGTPDEVEALDLYYTYQDEYVKQMSGLYDSLKYWLDLTMHTNCVNMNFFKMYKALKDQKDKGII